MEIPSQALQIRGNFQTAKMLYTLKLTKQTQEMNVKIDQ